MKNMKLCRTFVQSSDNRLFWSTGSLKTIFLNNNLSIFAIKGNVSLLYIYILWNLFNINVQFVLILKKIILYFSCITYSFTKQS